MKSGVLVLGIVCLAAAGHTQIQGQAPIVVSSEGRPVDPETGLVRIMDPLHEPLPGTPAADVEFAELDGAPVKLSAFRGKPLLLDFWATWCAPCREALPEFDRLYRELKDKGIVVVSFDQDKEPEKAVRFLAQNQYEWTNLHDPDRSIEDALSGKALPQTILIDAQGKFVYFGLGDDIAALRKAISGLGPEFASVGPQPAPTPDRDSADNSPQP